MNKHNDLKYARKMVLVPYKEEDQYLETYEDDIKTDKGMMKNLNMNMKNILNNKSLSDREKLFIHNQLLRKYLFVKEKAEKEKKEDVKKLIEAIRKPPQFSFNIPKSSKKKPNETDVKTYHEILPSFTPKTKEEKDENSNGAIREINEKEKSDEFEYSTPFSTLPVQPLKMRPKRRNAIDSRSEMYPYSIREGLTRKKLMQMSESDEEEEEEEKRKSKQKGEGGILSWSYLK